MDATKNHGKVIETGVRRFQVSGDFITETESAIDIEELVSKYVFGSV